MFDKVKQMGQIIAIQKQLAAQEVVIDEQGVEVVMTGDQKIKAVKIQGISNQILVEVLNKAIQKSQQVAASKLQQMSGGLSGLLGR